MIGCGKLAGLSYKIAQTTVKCISATQSKSNSLLSGID